MATRNYRKLIGLVLGPLLFVLIKWNLNPIGLEAQGIAVLAVTTWIGVWWITEAVEVEVTALLPIVLFPLSGGLGLAETCAAYGHKFIFLFVGGFILAIAIQKWNLHKRIALTVINAVGADPRRIILGFMLSTAFLSMWISNTATTVMMLPIGLAVVGQFNQRGKTKNLFATTLLLSIAYSASIGGIATLIGTPPNLLLAGIIEQSFNVEISFTKWFSIGFPISMLLLFICWYYLTRKALDKEIVLNNEGHQSIKEQLSALGKITFEEKSVFVVFVFTALLWITRSFLLKDLIPAIDDTIIAIGCAFLLFLLPSREGGQKLLTWSDAVKLPWGILILFGGGLSLAVGFQESGLAAWIATNLSVLEGIYVVVFILILVASVNFLTEITSNLATTSVILPVLIPLALALDVHPYMLLVAATLAASCAFMLPVATPPNAIIFASEHVALDDMMKAGFWMNVISIVIIVLFVYFLLPSFWGI